MMYIANLFASKFSSVLNKATLSSGQVLLASIHASLTWSHTSLVTLTEDDISDTISQLKAYKYDSSGVATEHLKFTSPVISNHLSSLSTSILHNGYMPECFRDLILIYTCS